MVGILDYIDDQVPYPMLQGDFQALEDTYLKETRVMELRGFSADEAVFTLNFALVI